MTEETWEKRWKRKPGAVCLPYTIQVVIPHTCKPDCAKAYRRLRREMTELFGGSTTYDAEGLWIDAKGVEIPDKVKVIESAHSCMTSETEKAFERAVYEAAAMAKQEAMAIKTGQYLIISTKAK